MVFTMQLRCASYGAILAFASCFALLCCGSSDTDGTGPTGSHGNASSSGAGGSHPGCTPSTVDTTHFCDRWAQICPNDGSASAVATCKTACEQGQMFSTENCSFA